ncbi:MAG: iron-sulfur cluster assembly protein [Acidimicrobiales bacterium]
MAPDPAAVRAAVAAVCDPEYPDLTIEELGMLEAVAVAGADVEVALTPTVFGCPALAMIERDVRAAAEAVPGVGRVRVTLLDEPRWSPDRIAPAARAVLAAQYTISIRGADGSVICPVCGSREVAERSAYGPTRCRSIAYCAACSNPVEVIRLTEAGERAQP